MIKDDFNEEKQKQVQIEVDRDEVYRCNECFDAAYRVTWISTGRGTINTGWVLTYCESCDEIRWLKRE
jgi:hypothetical protein